MTFKNRIDAGKRLAQALIEYAKQEDTLVIALPRGGVVIGYEISILLNIPLDIVCPRKIGAPDNPELAIGAVTETGEAILSQNLIQQLDIPKHLIESSIKQEKIHAQWRLEHYRKNRPPRHVEQKCVILVDDGLATGSTMRAAIKTVHAEKAKQIILAIPVAPLDTFSALSEEVDRSFCLDTPYPFHAVGEFYVDFEQTTDEEVLRLLQKRWTQNP